MSALRVALVTPSLDPIGGTEVYVAHAVVALLRAGAELSVHVQVAPREAPPGLRVVPWAAGLSEAMSPSAVLAHRGAAASIADELARADVVVFHRLVPGLVLRRLRGRTATLIAVHTSEYTCPAGARHLPVSDAVCERSPGVGCLASDLREGCLSTRDGRPFPLRQKLKVAVVPRLWRRLPRHATAFLYNSETTRRLMELHVGDDRPGRVVHPPLQDRPAAEVPRRPRQLAFVGRMVAGKGVADALEVCARLPRTRLVLCGDGPARAAVDGRPAALAERVDVRGWTSPAEVARTLAESSCLLVPSRLFEAFGQIGPQAIQEGCPVVAYDSGGIREWCTPAHGTLVRPGDVDALTRACQAWLDRLEGGLDTAGWRAEAQRRWGLERFSREYVAAVEAARAAFVGATRR